MSDTTNSNGQAEGLYGIDNAPTPLPALSACARGFLSEAYDFVIIGGGTAGLAVAARLTEDPNIVVGVLEVGKSRLDDPLVDTPATFPQLLGDPEYDHCFKSVPQVGASCGSHWMTVDSGIRKETVVSFITCAEVKLLAAQVPSTTCCEYSSELFLSLLMRRC
jgi:hypothetical protein